METKHDWKFWALAIGGTLVLAFGVLATMFFSTFHGPDDTFRLEAAKLLLQFVLAGVGGTLVLTYLNTRREREERVAAGKAAEMARDADARAAAMGRAAVRRAALQDLSARSATLTGALRW